MRDVVNASGTLVARYDYNAWGKPTKVSGTTVNASLLINSRYYHHAASGLHLALYRAYDPDLGRWINEDPIEEEGGINMYGYVRNSPLMAVDPLGLVDWTGFGESIKGSFGIGLEAGIKKCTVGPLTINGPSIGAAWKWKFDLGGGAGSSIDTSANLISGSVGSYKAGLGIKNESGFYNKAKGGPTETIDKTQKVCGLKKDKAKWDTGSPYKIGAEISALVNVGLSIDFGQMWDSLWR